jgi:UDP-hydrolysing UDP-N-acetyl-D-glucosamine 2-epimerase
VARRRIAIVLTTRGNYAKMKSVMRAIRARPDLELVTIVGGGIVQERFGDYRPTIVADGFAVDATADFLIDGGGTLDVQTKSAGAAVSVVGEALRRFAADVLLVIADRYEALAIALAATCMNVPIAHLEGGEVSGSIDERMRHAITKLAHLHLPANRSAAERILRMGEHENRVVIVGTPSLDLLAEIDLSRRERLDAAPGAEGDPIDFSKPYVVVSQHPVVTESEAAEQQIGETAAGLVDVDRSIVWILPNMDAGGAGVMRALDEVKRSRRGVPVRFYRSMEFGFYSVLLANADCLLGNSSSGIREGAYLGTPVVNIGTRQTGRERGRNVIDVPCESAAIAEALDRQLAHGRYTCDTLYGDGRAGEKIAAALAAMPLDLDKQITY